MKVMKMFSQEEIDIFKFIMEAYDKHTKNGEQYIPEIHDPIIFELASVKFGKTVKEIDGIYCNVAFKIVK